MNAPQEGCEVKTCEGRRCVSRRLRTPVSELPQRFQEVLESIFGEAIPKSCGAITPTGVPFAVYRNMDMNDLDVEIGVPAEGACALLGFLEWSETPSGTFAACIHHGPYDQMESTYQKLMQWVAEQHQTLGESILTMEIYHSDPDRTPLAELETEILLLLN